MTYFIRQSILPSDSLSIRLSVNSSFCSSVRLFIHCLSFFLLPVDLLSIYRSIFPPSIYLSVCPSVHCSSICLFVCLSIPLSVSPTIHDSSFCLSAHSSVCLSICPQFIYLPVCSFLSLPVHCPSIYLSVHPSFC